MPCRSSDNRENVHKVAPPAASIMPLAPCRDEYAGEYQAVTDQMKQLRLLAEEADRQHRAEHRDQMIEWRRSIGADQFDAAIVAKIGEYRREENDIGQRQHGLGVE